MDACLVLVTARNAQEAEQIQGALVRERLAACVSLLPVRSTYRWKGKVEQAQEIQLLIKTRSALLGKIIARVKAIHSYENPEILAIPILEGSKAYLRWLEEETTQ